MQRDNIVVIVKFEESWEWTDGSSVDFALWEKNEPNGLEGETCVEMYKVTGKWNDISCNSGRDFICKAPSKTQLVCRLNHC